MERLDLKHTAQYFEEYTCSHSGEVAYRLKRDYWKDKTEQKWSHLPDLF